eukprot:506074-Prorocentrum_minimum.AAC.1
MTLRPTGGTPPARGGLPTKPRFVTTSRHGAQYLSKASSFYTLARPPAMMCRHNVELIWSLGRETGGPHPGQSHFTLPSANASASRIEEDVRRIVIHPFPPGSVSMSLMGHSFVDGAFLHWFTPQIRSRLDD